MSTQSPDATSPVRVFLSYAWESDAYRMRVEQLAVRLREDGIDARLDRWHVGEQPIPSFMSSETRRRLGVDAGDRSTLYRRSDGQSHTGTV